MTGVISGERHENCEDRAHELDQDHSQEHPQRGGDVPAREVDHGLPPGEGGGGEPTVDLVHDLVNHLSPVWFHRSTPLPPCQDPLAPSGTRTRSATCHGPRRFGWTIVPARANRRMMSFTVRVGTSVIRLI